MLYLKALGLVISLIWSFISKRRQPTEQQLQSQVDENQKLANAMSAAAAVDGMSDAQVADELKARGELRDVPSVQGEPK
jgi:hypothetical protein